MRLLTKLISNGLVDLPSKFRFHVTIEGLRTKERDISSLLCEDIYQIPLCQLLWDCLQSYSNLDSEVYDFRYFSAVWLSDWK